MKTTKTRHGFRATKDGAITAESILRGMRLCKRNKPKTACTWFMQILHDDCLDVATEWSIKQPTVGAK